MEEMPNKDVVRNTRNRWLEDIGRIKALDIAKMTYKCYMLTAEHNYEDRAITSGSMTLEGRMRFAESLRKGDIVVMEGGTSSFNFARELINYSPAEVVVLNPAKLHFIFRSQCKTDKQDSVKLARYIRDTSRENWVRLNLPTPGETTLRSVINFYNAAKVNRTRAINRLHAIFNQNGFPMLKKSDMADTASRQMNISRFLSGSAVDLAMLTEQDISNIEIAIEYYKQMMRDELLKWPKETAIWFSMPGIGLITCASLVAYIGDCSRFYTPAQLRNYVAIVPKIDQSGTQCNIGRLSTYGCKPVRKNIIQGALSIEKLASDCPLRRKALELKAKGMRRQLIGVKIANKMLTIGFTLMKSGTLYNGFGNYSRLKRKLSQEGLEAIDLSIFPELR